MKTSIAIAIIVVLAAMLGTIGWAFHVTANYKCLWALFFPFWAGANLSSVARKAGLLASLNAVALFAAVAALGIIGYVVHHTGNAAVLWAMFIPLWMSTSLVINPVRARKDDGPDDED